jgi:hypothetical protein
MSKIPYWIKTIVLIVIVELVLALLLLFWVVVPNPHAVISGLLAFVCLLAAPVCFLAASGKIEKMEGLSPVWKWLLFFTGLFSTLTGLACVILFGVAMGFPFFHQNLFLVVFFLLFCPSMVLGIVLGFVRIAAQASGVWPFEEEGPPLFDREWRKFEKEQQEMEAQMKRMEQELYMRKFWMPPAKPHNEDRGPRG